MISYLLVVEQHRTQIVIHALLKCQQENLYHEQKDRKSGSAGMPRPNSYAVFCLKNKKLAGLSPGMLSKIENGMTSPSLATLQALSRALNVPVTALFRKFEEHRDASFVRSGEGLKIERRGTRAGHQYQLLGHLASHRDLVVEPYMITLTK